MASVSVVLPVWRGRMTVARAIDSVARQTVRPIELVVVDDGSNDDTWALLQSLDAAYPPGWMRLILLDKNCGAAFARNIGWDAAKADYIAFLDADDAWHPEKIERQMAWMEAHPDITFSGHGYWLPHGRAGRSPWFISSMSRKMPSWMFLLSNPFVTPSVMVRRDVSFRFEKNQRYVDDHLLWMQMVLLGQGAAFLPDKLVYVYKPPYGESGLSADMWNMERAELENYCILNRSGLISRFTTVLLMAFSLLKYLRRICLVGFRRIRQLSNKP